MNASQSEEPTGRTPRGLLATLVEIATAILVFAALSVLIAAIISLLGHGVDSIETRVDALTPRPGLLGGWWPVYVTGWALVYGYLLIEAKTGRQRLWYVLMGLAVLGVSYALLSKTEAYASYQYGPPVGSCGSWLTPSAATIAYPDSYCVVKLDSLFRWGFVIAIGGLAVPMLYTARQQSRQAKATSRKES